MKNNNFKTSKGITLIALIITIIVLLILAVVAINSVKNDGIIEHAQSAKTKHQIAQEKESISLAINEAYLIGKGRITKESLQTALNGAFNGNIQYTDTTSNEYIKIDLSGREYIVYLNGTIEGPLGEGSGGGSTGDVVIPPEEGEEDEPTDDPIIEISVTEPVVVDASGNEQTQVGSITSGSLYIQFKPTLEGGTINSVTLGEVAVTSETDGTYKYEVTENGTFEFSIKGTANGKEYTKTVSVKVNQFMVIISKTDTYLGYYADVDGNGSVDGIIYADLAKNGGGTWSNSTIQASVSYIHKENLDEYYIIKEEHEESGFGKKPVIAPIDKEEENDRFYVMSLKDFNEGALYCWYYGAFDYDTLRGNMVDHETDTSEAFGKGKENTTKMIGFWKAKKYGAGDAGDYKDIWGQLDSQVANGWFVPSKDEWTAFGVFAEQKGVTASNCLDYGLSDYWSSSGWTTDAALGCDFEYKIAASFVVVAQRIRLSITF